MSAPSTFTSLNALATHLRQELENKKFILLYAYNGTGKTRLSTAFKDLGKSADADGETDKRDTLYFNAFTEDLFSWDNDLESDSERKLTLTRIQTSSRASSSMEMDNRIRALLGRYADFEFRIDTTRWEAVFAREFRVKKDDTAGNVVDSVGAGQGDGEDDVKPAARSSSRSPVARRTSSFGASSLPSSSSRSMTTEPVPTIGSSTSTLMTQSRRLMSTTPLPWQIIWPSCSGGRRAG